MLIDTHLHLVDSDYNIDEVINRARNNGVNKLIVSGSDLNDNFLNIKVLGHRDNIYFTCGFHPELAGKVTNEDLNKLEELLKNNKVVGVGEIGLDYHYSKENKEEQKKLFIKQLKLAVKYNLPIVVHTRDAFLDTYNILKNYNLKGVIHCFSGSYEVAKQYISLGYFLGIGGVVTFKNSNLKEIIKKIRIKNIVLETDSPFLSPYRGEKNEPANVKKVAEFISDYLDISFTEVSEVTTLNAEKIFNIK